MPFIRSFTRSEGGGAKEQLINVSHISRIVIKYVGEGGFEVATSDAIDNPETKRVYEVHIAGEVLYFVSADDPVTRTLEKIYRDAIKG